MFWWASPEKEKAEDRQNNNLINFREAIRHVIRLRNVWILCIATAGVSGCVNGMLGFLPLYLRDLGWKPAMADSTLASFHAVSLLFAIPIAMFSDRIGSRRGVLMAAAILIGIGARFAGSAIGLNMSVLGVANALAPPVGNWLAGFWTGLPFIFWASLVLTGSTGYLFLRRPKAKHINH